MPAQLLYEDEESSIGSHDAYKAASISSGVASGFFCLYNAIAPVTKGAEKLVPCVLVYDELLVFEATLT